MAHHGTLPITPFDYHWEHILNGPAGHYALLNDLGIVLAKYAPEIWAVIFILLWFWPPLRQNRSRRAVVYSVVAGAIALVVNVIISHVAPYRPRPFVADPHQVHALISHARDSSFPSDHAAGSFGFAIGLMFAGATDGILALILAFAVAWARVFVGVHWPTDVMVGGAVGVVVGFVVLAARRYLDWLVDLLFALFRFKAPVGKYQRSRQ